MCCVAPPYFVLHGDLSSGVHGASLPRAADCKHVSTGRPNTDALATALDIHHNVSAMQWYTAGRSNTCLSRTAACCEWWSPLSSTTIAAASSRVAAHCRSMADSATICTGILQCKSILWFALRCQDRTYPRCCADGVRCPASSIASTTSKSPCSACRSCTIMVAICEHTMEVYKAYLQLLYGYVGDSTCRRRGWCCIGDAINRQWRCAGACGTPA